MKLKHFATGIFLVALIAVVIVFKLFFGEQSQNLATATSPNGRVVASIAQIHKSQWGSDPDMIEVYLGFRLLPKSLVFKEAYDGFTKSFRVEWNDEHNLTIDFSSDDESRKNSSWAAMRSDQWRDVRVHFRQVASWFSPTPGMHLDEKVTSPDGTKDAELRVDDKSSIEPTTRESRMRFSVVLSPAAKQNTYLPTTVYATEDARSAHFSYGVRWVSSSQLEILLPLCADSTDCIDGNNPASIVLDKWGDVSVKYVRNNGSIRE